MKDFHAFDQPDIIRLLIGVEFDKARLKEIILLCPKAVDWEALGCFCESHGIGPLVSRTLFSVPGIPAKALKVFQVITDRSQARSVVFVHRLREVLQELQAQGMGTLVLKGPVYAETIYSNPILRPFEDLDLLIGSKDVSKAAYILGRIGFTEIGSKRERRFIRSGFHRKFRSPDGTVVELHWELLHPDFRALPVNAVWEMAQTRILYGIRIQTLSPLDEFIYACAHVAKHLAGCTLTKVIWISDLKRLLPAEISPVLSARIRKLRCRRMVFFAVALINRFQNLAQAEMEPWAQALEIGPVTQQFIWKNAHPKRVVRCPATGVPWIRRLVHRSLMADDTRTILRFPVAYLKRHMIQGACRT
jgi:hypothetical protein